jgi:hypothetical protein
VGSRQDFSPGTEVTLQCLFGFALQRNIALLFAFSPHQEHAVCGIKVSQFDSYQFGIPQTTAIEQLEDSAITFGKGSGLRHAAVQQRVHFF